MAVNNNNFIVIIEQIRIAVEDSLKIKIKTELENSN